MLKRATMSTLALLALLALATACTETESTPAPANDAGPTDGTSDTTAADTGADTAAPVDTTKPPHDTPTAKDTGTGTKDTGGNIGANTSFKTAADLTLKTEIKKELKPTGAIHYYMFSGTKGQVLDFSLVAKGTDQTLAFKADNIDTVLTLFDADQKQIAQNDDPFPRITNDSTLRTILPATGVYYITVQECWTWIESLNKTEGCAPPKDKTLTEYALTMIEINPAASVVFADDEKGDDINSANAITYTKISNGGYAMNVIYGLFSDAEDVDVYSFTPPHDTPIGKTRAVTYCDFYPAGPDGNGSTTTPGVAWMASAASPTVAMASVDLTKGGSLAPPVTLDKLHYLFVPRALGKAGANDFYFINQLVSGSYPIELNDVANNKYEGAEELAPTDNPNGGTSFFVEGNLTPAKTDMDHYSVAIPTGATNLAVFCSAQRSGSGLRDLTVTVLNDDGSATTGLALETPDNGATIQQLAIPADTKKLIIQLKAGSQAADVTGDYYRCGIAATAP